MSLQQYLTLKLDSESPEHKDLLSRMEVESGREQLSLTPPYSEDGVPGYLTPAMASWYNRHIQPLRRTAVH